MKCGCGYEAQNKRAMCEHMLDVHQCLYAEDDSTMRKISVDVLNARINAESNAVKKEKMQRMLQEV